MTPDGTIERLADGSIAVTVPKKPWGDVEGVICLNPSAPQTEQLYQKVFRNKKIYMPDEYDLALNNHIRHPDNFVISMNGYSSITPEQCKRYDIQHGAYEQACIAIMRSAISFLRQKFTGAQLRLIDGASDMGVDRAAIEVSKEYNMVSLGFSCPRFMPYVKDDDRPVYVGSTKDEYADKYIRTLDLLIATGGREHALHHDIVASIKYNKVIHFIDVLNLLSPTGCVPPTITQTDGSVSIENAAAAMGRNVSFFTRDDAKRLEPPDGDIWDSVFSNVRSVVTKECRRKMSPERKFG